MAAGGGISTPQIPIRIERRLVKAPSLSSLAAKLLLAQRSVVISDEPACSL